MLCIEVCSLSTPTRLPHKPQALRHPVNPSPRVLAVLPTFVPPTLRTQQLHAPSQKFLQGDLERDDAAVTGGCSSSYARPPWSCSPWGCSPCVRRPLCPPVRPPPLPLCETPPPLKNYRWSWEPLDCYNPPPPDPPNRSHIQILIYFEISFFFFNFSFIVFR